MRLPVLATLRASLSFAAANPRRAALAFWPAVMIEFALGAMFGEIPDGMVWTVAVLALYIAGFTVSACAWHRVILADGDGQPETGSSEVVYFLLSSAIAASWLSLTSLYLLILPFAMRMAYYTTFPLGLPYWSNYALPLVVIIPLALAILPAWLALPAIATRQPARPVKLVHALNGNWLRVAALPLLCMVPNICSEAIDLWLRPPFWSIAGLTAMALTLISYPLGVGALSLAYRHLLVQEPLP